MNRVLGLTGLLAVLLAACGSGSSSNNKGSSSYKFTYSMTASPSEFAAGRLVAVVDQPTTGDASCNTATGSIVRAEATVTTSGSVAVSMNLPKSSFKNYYLETIYVDVDANHHLNNGDLTMGPDSSGFGAFCNSIGTDNQSFTFDWDALQSSAFGGGPSTWTGGTQTYSAEPGVLMDAIPGRLPNLRAMEGVTPGE